jgi:hypothetical protein
MDTIVKVSLYFIFGVIVTIAFLSAGGQLIEW